MLVYRHVPAGFLVAAITVCAHGPAQSQATANPRHKEAAAQVRRLPVPQASPNAQKTETYSVVVNNVRLPELLFALAREAQINVDIHPGIDGSVTLNAVEQTLPQILTRLARQADMRWEFDGPNVAVMPDTPFLRNYRIDYVNMSRDATGSVSISTQIGATTSVVGGGQVGTSGPGANVSTTKVDNAARNRFWESIERNIKDLLRETDKILPDGSSETLIERSDAQATSGTGAPAGAAGGKRAAHAGIAASPNPATLAQNETTVVKRATFREAASVIINAESGIVAVRATSRQHEKVQDFITQVAAAARRQVLVEATIAEVRLSDEYRQGINWQSLRSQRTDPGSHSAGFQMGQNPTGVPVPDPLASSSSGFVLNYVAPGLGISATISLLETFGNVRVLSSPKISVLNNQTALLKVVNNVVYFDIKADTTTTTNGLATTTVTTTPRSVSVGLVMTVTPQIGDNDAVLLNVRPSISRVSGFKNDPNPTIPAGLVNAVPEIETREMESMLRLDSGETAVLGGLMQDTTDNTTQAVPGLANLPLIGNFFKQRNETSTKTELVIFLRPLVIRDPSVRGDFGDFRDKLPGADPLAGNAFPGATRADEGGRTLLARQPDARGPHAQRQP